MKQRHCITMFVLFIISLLFISCTIRSLNGTIIYTSKKAMREQDKEEKRDQGMRKPKGFDTISGGGKPFLYAGLRRSSYGLRKRNDADTWWAVRAKEFAASVTHTVNGEGTVQPVIIQIISMYKGDGTTVMEFEKPSAYTGPTRNMTFIADRGINHERALQTYDDLGVKAILQFEPGNSDMLANIAIAHQAFGHHACIVGYGIDAEWYFTKESKDTTGLPVEDENAEKWLRAVLALNPAFTLFLKHWDPAHMPQSFRHPNLWFLSDSQIFNSLDECMADFTFWARSHEGQIVGYQYGYPSDKKWWQRMENPILDITRRILADIPLTRYIFWVDFTADEVDFK